jgi:hypothetical protein
MVTCKFCQDKFTLNGLAHANDLICMKCDINFGTTYCFSCLPYYYDIKRKLCLKCERGIEG